MNDKHITLMNARIQLGRLRQNEDESGRLTHEFVPECSAWACIKPVSFSVAACMQQQKPMLKSNTLHMYVVKIRKNVLPEGRQNAINAIVWKYKILTNFYFFRSDQTEMYLEGLFCDQGQEL